MKNSSDNVQMPTHTIGVALPKFWDGFQIPFLSGIHDASLRYNMQSIVFQGMYNDLNYRSDVSDRESYSGEIIFDILKKFQIEGLILNSASIHAKVDKLKLVELCKHHFNIPLLNIGSPHEGMLNVQIDNVSGMTELMNHLVNEHGYRMFGFIKGPHENHDALERFEVFKKLLHDWNIEIDTEQIIDSQTWSIECGAVAARMLIERFGKKLDAIICASDILASGAMTELQKHNIDIPDDIAIVGFNDNYYAATANPPLTTVQLRLYERSFHAIEILDSYFRYNTLPDIITIPSKIIIRQSCGCHSTGILAHSELKHLKKRGKISKCKNTSDKQIIIDDINSILSSKGEYLEENIVDDIANNFLLQCSDCKTNSFLSTFYEILLRKESFKEKISIYHWVINVLYKFSENHLDGECLKTINNYLLQARLLIGDIKVLNNQIMMIEDQELSNRVNSLNYGYKKAEKLSDVYMLMISDLPKMHIPQFYLFLYDQADNPVSDIKLVVSYNQNNSSELPEGGVRMKGDSLSLFKVNSANQSGLIFIEPLFYGVNQIGFTIFSVDSLEKSFRTLFPSQLSCALWGAILIKKESETEQLLQKQSNELQISNNKIELRTCQLMDAYTQLEQNKEQLIMTEKMASIGKLTSGVTTELREPLADAKKAISDLISYALQYTKLLNDQSTTKDKMRSNADKIIAAIDKAESVIKKAHVFIRSIKTQTRNSSNDESIVFNLVEITKNVIVFLKHTHQKESLHINFNCSESSIILSGSSIRMTQALTNVVTNSIESLIKDRFGQIDIDINKDNRVAMLSIKDNGCGIDESSIKSVFEPMFTTKNTENNTGMGLAVVNDIIYGEFEGKIDIKSQINVGTTFMISLPLHTDNTTAVTA